eukprot:3802356-Rhodomonas_salina.2
MKEEIPIRPGTHNAILSCSHNTRTQFQEVRSANVVEENLSPGQERECKGANSVYKNGSTPAPRFGISGLIKNLEIVQLDARNTQRSALDQEIVEASGQWGAHLAKASTWLARAKARYRAPLTLNWFTAHWPGN